MEELRGLDITYPFDKQKQQRYMSEEEALTVMRTCRATVDQLLQSCWKNLKTGQSDCKGIRDLMGASHNFSPNFHPPSRATLQECYILGETLLIALASSRVPVESQIMFSTTLIQILVSGPCALVKESNFCQSCSAVNSTKDLEEMLSQAQTEVTKKYNVKMQPIENDAKSIITNLVKSKIWSLPVEKADSFELCLCYALVMSSSRLQNQTTTIRMQVLVSPEISEIIFEECSKFSKLTTLAFKTLSSWLEKVSVLGLSLSNETIRRIYTIVPSSWEIALSGVRKDNSKALALVLSIDASNPSPQLPSPVSQLDAVVKEHLWTDVGKFYMLTELVEHLGAQKVMEKYGKEMVDGIISSFRSNQLASAGAHLYESLLKHLPCAVLENVFLEPILSLIYDIDGDRARHLRKLQRDSTSLSASIDRVRTVQYNIVNYWLRITANVLPDTLGILRDATYGKLMSSQFQSDQHLSFLAAGTLHLSRKKGLWDPLKDAEFRKMASYRDDITGEIYFKTLCVSCKLSDEIHENEFEMIEDYLKSHVNVDSARVRQEMVRSMNAFFQRLHVSTMHQQKLHPEEDKCGAARKFLHQFIRFLSENLASDGLKGKKISYQRRITSLQLYLELLRSVNNVKCLRLKDVNALPCAEIIKTWHSGLEQQTMLTSCLEDETDNIQNTAFIILKERISDMERYDREWLDAGIEKCQSPKAHIAQSGRFYVLLATDSLYFHCGEVAIVEEKLQNDYPEFKKHFPDSCGLKTPVTLLLFNLGLKNWKDFQSNPMELTRSTGLHGIIDTITAVALKSQGSEFGNLECSFQEKLLNFVEDIANFCINMFMSSNENTECAPSFAEMGIAIKNAARQTTENPGNAVVTDNELSINTSADERLLVKHLWLNLKACCNFASYVNGPAEIMQKCLDIIINVLRRCRHKGANESAGESLQNLISRITKVPKSGDDGAKDQKKRELPMAVLKDFLDDLVSGRTAHKTSTTRRSAGLAIFVHHIVIGDADPEKPLLRIAISHLMTALDTPISDENINETDLPQAQSLHIMRTLVADASLRVSLTAYVNNIAQSALMNLTSPVWSVRNGALQLFGALVPILVGQESSLAQFHFHHQKLLESLVSFAESVAAKTQSSLQAHNDAVPVLVLLSRLNAPPALLSSETLIKIVQRLRTTFIYFLGSDIMAVRCLAARGVARISCIEDPSQTIEEVRIWLEGNSSENAIHGSLMAADYIIERCRSEGKKVAKMNVIGGITKFAHRCGRSGFGWDLCVIIMGKLNEARREFSKHPDNRKSFYIDEDRIKDFIQCHLRRKSSNVDEGENDLREALENITDIVFRCPALAGNVLLNLLEFLQTNPQIPDDLKVNVLNTALKTISILKNREHPITNTHIEKLFHQLNGWKHSTIRATAYPVLLGLLSVTNFRFPFKEEIVQSFFMELKNFCSFLNDGDNNNQVQMAEGLVFLAPALIQKRFCSISRDFFAAALWFLQSEDADVRDQAAEVIATQRLSHTECILKLVDPEFLRARCENEVEIALSLCDRLWLSDDELLEALSEMRREYDVNIWRRENPYVEDWFIADLAYRQLDAFIDSNSFTEDHLRTITGSLRMIELTPFLEKCSNLEKFSLKENPAELADLIVKSDNIKNHRKTVYRTNIQEKCQQKIQRLKEPGVYKQ